MARRAKQTDLLGLEAFALLQHGYFHRRDAHTFGLSDALLSYHTRTGRFERCLPAVYRLRIAPLDVDDNFVQAWVWTGYRGALSHESALEIYELSDVAPSWLHVTLPPGSERTAIPPTYRLYVAPLPPDEVQDYATIRLTAPGRSIVDAAIAGTEPRQIIMAVWQALDRHITTPEELRRLAERGSDTSHRRYVQRIIDETIADHAA
jgi:predicted transcriptional regulator of viral defense system